MVTVLVTGGAGYIGSHACKVLAQAGYTPVTYDNLSRGHRSAVKWGPFEHGDLLDDDRLNEVLSIHKPQAVMHFAALALVGESVDHPDLYFRNNVDGSRVLIEAMIRADVSKIVFSSTCAVYGLPKHVPIGETAPVNPINPYGETKLAVEQMLAKHQKSGALSYMALRYFNAAGADPDGDIGEDHDPEPHLIPRVLFAATVKDSLVVIGNNYPTPYGTCIRDYVHATDLAIKVGS